MCEIYRIFAKDLEHICDFSEKMMLELFYSESFGDIISPMNGFYQGKRLLNVTIAMWKEDIERGLLQKCELYNDELFPHWWLNKVLKNIAN